MSEKINKKKQKLVILVSALLLLASFGSPHPARAAGAPSIFLVAPASGSTVSTTFSVTFAVKNFNLVQPGDLTNCTSCTTEGHLHVFLDGNYYLLWATANSIPFVNIIPGPHTILIQMVNDTHAPLGGTGTSLTLNYQVSDTPGTPTLKILSPADSSSVPSNLVVSFIVANFTLTNPVGQPSALNTGHLHVFVDGNYYNLWARPEGVPLTLSGGSHTIKLQLVNNNHTALSPDVSKSIIVNVNDVLGASANNASNYSLAATILSVIAVVIGVLVISRVWKKSKPPS
jgi:Family of unknown function (DUF6130)